MESATGRSDGSRSATANAAASKACSDTIATRTPETTIRPTSRSFAGDATSNTTWASLPDRVATVEPSLRNSHGAVATAAISTSSGTAKSTRCPSHRRGVRFYRSQYAKHLEKRGLDAERPMGRKPRSCPDARMLAVVWRKRAARARKQAERYLARLILKEGSWRYAVEQVQRPYPGTRDWLLSCSASEGGWGRWVPNSQGSGVGGWLQFMPGTFAGMNRRAREEVTARKFRLPASADSWYSPLGQALAGAWAYRNGLTHHWYGSGC